MPRGFLSRIIYLLLGEKERKPEIREPVPKAAPSGKAWVPDLASRHVHPSLKKEEKIILQKERRGIAGMLERMFLKAGHAVSGRLNIKNLLISSPFIAALIIVLLALTPVFSFIKAFLIIILLILLAAASKLIQKLFPFVVGFDMCLFFTVIVGLAYHPLIGMMVGVVSSALGSVARGQYDMDKVIFPLFGNIIVALLLPVMPFSDIFYTEMASALIYAVLMSVIFGLTMGFSPVWLLNAVTFFVTSVGFNYWLFRTYGAALMRVLAG